MNKTMDIEKRSHCRPSVAGLLGILCFALGGWAGQKPQTGRAAAASEAAWVVGQLEAATWHSNYAAWKAGHASIPCRVFEGDGSSLFIVDLWTYRCTSVAASGRASDFFYILNPTGTPDSQLDEFQGEILQSPELPVSAIQRIYDRAEAMLTERYGKPDKPQSVPALVAAWGSGDWRLLRVWNMPDQEICLYIRDTPGEPIAVGLLARDRALALASMNEGTQLLLNEQPDAVFEDQIDNSLAADLKKDYPDLANLLSDTGAQPSPATVLNALFSTLERAISAPVELHAELLLAADRLVTRLHLPDTAALPAGLASALERLKTTAGMNFSWDELGETWVYHHDLLWTVWKGVPQTEWGQDAFFLLLEQGWDTSGVCQAGADQFRTVISQGEQFLAEFPSSPARLAVMYLMAQANETWWSLSQWSSCSPVTDLGLAPCAPAPASARYQPGAAAAREKAMSEYKALLGADPETYGTPEIRRSLARMEMGIDTNQRRFYCLYD